MTQAAILLQQHKWWWEIFWCEARLEMLQNDIESFPVVNKRSTRTKNMLKWRKDPGRKRDSTEKAFAINLLPPKNTYVYTPHTYICTYVCVVCMCACVCAANVCICRAVCYMCAVCVCKTGRDNYYKLSSVCTYTPQCMYMHTHTKCL